MPTLSASFNVNSAARDQSTLITPSFTPAAGDVIIVKYLMENSGGQSFGVVTDTQGNVYTTRVSVSTGANCHGLIASAIAGAGASMTVSATNDGVSLHSMTVECWTVAALAGTPAINGTKTGTGSPTSTITTTQAGSAVSWCNGDFDGTDPVGRTYNTTSATPTEDGLDDKSDASTGSVYVGYYAWQSAASAGSQTLGLTAPTGQTWTLLAVEILDVASSPSADQNQPSPILAWQ